MAQTSSHRISSVDGPSPLPEGQARRCDGPSPGPGPTARSAVWTRTAAKLCQNDALGREKSLENGGNDMLRRATTARRDSKSRPAHSFNAVRAPHQRPPHRPRPGRLPALCSGRGRRRPHRPKPWPRPKLRPQRRPARPNRPRTSQPYVDGPSQAQAQARTPTATSEVACPSVARASQCTHRLVGLAVLAHTFRDTQLRGNFQVNKCTHEPVKQSAALAMQNAATA